MAKTDILAKMAELLGIPYRPRATGKKTESILLSLIMHTFSSILGAIYFSTCRFDIT